MSQPPSHYKRKTSLHFHFQFRRRPRVTRLRRIVIRLTLPCWWCSCPRRSVFHLERRSPEACRDKHPNIDGHSFRLGVKKHALTQSEWNRQMPQPQSKSPIWNVWCSVGSPWVCTPVHGVDLSEVAPEGASCPHLNPPHRIQASSNLG